MKPGYMPTKNKGEIKYHTEVSYRKYATAKNYQKDGRKAGFFRSIRKATKRKQKTTEA